MKYCWLGCLLVGNLLFAGTQDSDLNVNRRYTVDTVIVAGKGWQTNVADQQSDRLSSGLRKDLAALIGQKLNPGTLDGLAARLKKELSAREVSHHILRGETPEHVRVEFEVMPARTVIDATVTKFLYDSQQGWSGAGAVGFTTHQNTFLFGLASDGDTLNERFAGISARYENKHLGTDRLGLRFQFESYHEQWNQSTLNALAAQPNQTSDAYRTRQNFQPTAIISLAKPLTLEVGVAFENFQNQYPAAHTESANALISTLRYHQRLAESEYQQDVDAGYTLRAATRAPGHRLRVHLAPGGTALPRGARQTPVDGAGYGWARSAGGRRCRIASWQATATIFVAGTSTILTQLGETGWFTTPSNTGMGPSRRFTIQGPSGRAASL